MSFREYDNYDGLADDEGSSQGGQQHRDTIDSIVASAH